MRIIDYFIAFVIFVACSPVDYTEHVDPLIGSSSHGHVFVGVSRPFGMIQVGPVNYKTEWDWCSGYHYSDTSVVGFSHTHLSGTGIGDLGDVSIMPISGCVPMRARDTVSEDSSFVSLFSRKNEKAGVGKYEVYLDRYGIKAELTATERVAFHRYTYESLEESGLILDLLNGIGWDKMTECMVSYEDSRTICGYRYSTGWAKDQRLYFCMRLSEDIVSVSDYDGDILKEGETFCSTSDGVFRIDTDVSGGELLVKVSISATSIDNAKLNMDAELSTWDFDQIVAETTEVWRNTLSKIEIETDNDTLKTSFYTALYHSMLSPNLFNDVTGDYRGAEKEFTVHNWERNIYTTFSLWDTYRSFHPLATLIHYDRVNDFVCSMLHIYRQQGRLPVWHLHGNETDCMVGNPAIPVIADAILKGYCNFDINQAYESMLYTSICDARNIPEFRKYGYVPVDSVYESVSKSLEYYIADYCISRVADYLHKQDIAVSYMASSKKYYNLYDKERGFFRPRYCSGEWKEPFDPFEINRAGNDYTEGNAWQYLWLVPHDVHGLVDLMGGEQLFEKRLDSLFILGAPSGIDLPGDITGCIGQYVHGNEPSHHIAYLYNYIGKQWKCAETVDKIMSTMYKSSPDGLCGNDDTGQMSAWYVLSSIGLYQVEPAGLCFQIGRPMFEKVKVRISDDEYFTIIAHNNNRINKYIQKLELDGKPYGKSYIEYDAIKQGSTLELWMGNKPAEPFFENASF